MKKVWAWLRMFQPSEDIESSEARYNANLNNIDAALPANGGKLQADGTWLQEPWKLNPAWPQSVKQIAHTNGQLYLPTVSCDGAGIQVILDTPALQTQAADNLIALATTGRFDSPWDGIYLDLEGTPDAYRDRLSQFLYLLSYRIRSAGLLCAVSVRGRTDDIVDYDGAYSYDFSVVAQVADIVDVRCYGFWEPSNGWIERSNAPHFWIRECIEYALAQGIPAQRLMLGLGNSSRHSPSGEGRQEISHTLAMQLVTESESRQEWIEHDYRGLIRERFADLGAGYLWIADGDTFRHGLGLIDEYDLMGCAHFIAGMGDEYHWQVIEDWRNEQ